MRKFPVVLLLLFFPVGALAGVDSFECRVSVAHVVSEDGTLLTDTTHLKEQIGSTFSVNRKSGEIRGGYFINNSHSKDVSVIDSGPGGDYYVISVSHGPKKSVGYLYIEEFRTWAKKPFTFTAGGGYFYSGLCW